MAKKREYTATHIVVGERGSIFCGDKWLSKAAPAGDPVGVLGMDKYDVHVGVPGRRAYWVDAAYLLRGYVLVERGGRAVKLPKLVKCSCEESQHLRAALRKIHLICTEETEGSLLDDVAQCGNLAHQALQLEPLVGDPGLGTKVPR